MQAGFGDFQVSQWKGKRKDAYATHLKDALGRPNLSVVTGAHATQLATESGSSGTRAVGVEYAVGGPSGSRQTGVQERGVCAACFLSCRMCVTRAMHTHRQRLQAIVAGMAHQPSFGAEAVPAY